MRVLFFFLAPLNARSTALTGILVLPVLAVYAHWPTPALPPGTVATHVVVNKGTRILQLYQGAQLLRQYPVALGFNPVGHKQREGDGKTPEGQYSINRRNPNSQYHLSLQVSYPTAAQQAAAQAQGINPGGLIMVHGVRKGLGWLGRFHTLWDWTAGCVAVTNAEIEEIWRVVPNGTPIHIQP